MNTEHWNDLMKTVQKLKDSDNPEIVIVAVVLTALLDETQNTYQEIDDIKVDIDNKEDDGATWGDLADLRNELEDLRGRVDDLSDRED